MLINVAVLLTTNVTTQQTEKELKYESLCTEIQRMWNMICVIILERIVTEV
jgi:hypothetical protein